MNTYILLSSSEQVYSVTINLSQPSLDSPNVKAKFELKTIGLLGIRHKEQLEYAQKAAYAAHKALCKLDWHHQFGAELELTPYHGDALSLELGSDSSGLGYALALHVEFRSQLDKHLPVEMPVVFATGRVESSGVVEKIGDLLIKLEGAFYCAQSRHAVEPFVVYYPKANEADVSDELRAKAMTRGGRLVAVSCVGEALLDLLGDTYDGDLASRLEPFKGLASFDFSDQFFFFGREEALSRLQEDYARCTGLLVVTGPSGAGKSSLIKAGLLPELRNTNPSLRYSITQPKQHESLTELLQSLLDSDYAECTVTAKDLLTQDKEAEATFITYAKEQLATVWYLDQFEEAVNLFDKELESSKFTATLHRLASAIPNLSIVASVRSEYVSSIGFLPNQSPVSPTIPPHGFQSIIVNQAKKFGLWYEIGLVDRLIEEATIIQHALPALSYILQQMNELRKQQVPEGYVLTHAQYDALGGLKGGITQQLETVLQAHDHRLADEFFERAIGLNETLNENNQLYARSMIKEQMPTHLQPLIHALIDKQLLIGWQTEQGTRLRLAHDSLLQTSWSRLKAWLEPENSTSRKGYLQWLEHNWGDFQKWSVFNGNEQAKAFLLTGYSLTEGFDYYANTSLIKWQEVRNFILVSYIRDSIEIDSKIFVDRRLEELSFLAESKIFDLHDCIMNMIDFEKKLIGERLTSISKIVNEIRDLKSDYDQFYKRWTYADKCCSIADALFSDPEGEGDAIYIYNESYKEYKYLIYESWDVGGEKLFDLMSGLFDLVKSICNGYTSIGLYGRVFEIFSDSYMCFEKYRYEVAPHFDNSKLYLVLLNYYVARTYYFTRDFLSFQKHIFYALDVCEEVCHIGFNGGKRLCEYVEVLILLILNVNFSSFSYDKCAEDKLRRSFEFFQKAASNFEFVSEGEELWLAFEFNIYFSKRKLYEDPEGSSNYLNVAKENLNIISTLEFDWKEQQTIFFVEHCDSISSAKTRVRDLEVLINLNLIG